MPDRQAALAALQQCLDRSVTDPARVLSQEAEGAAAGLAAVVEPETDLVAARTLGRYHWLRSHVLAQRGHMGDLDAVLRFMLPVYWADPDLVPEPLRTAFRTEPGLAPLVHEGPEALADRATGMVIAFGRSGTLQDLRTAATFFRAAAARTAPDHEDRLVRLNDLGVCLRDLYARTRDQGVLAEAITTERAAVRLARGRPGLAHLGTALQRLFARTAHMGDLEDAVEAGRESVALADEDDPARPGYLTGLGGAVRSLYLRVNRMELLEEAIRAEREVVALIPPGHPRRAMYLNNLASTLQILWMRTEDRELLDEAVDTQRQAVRTTPGSHPARAGRLIGLVSLLRMQYEGTENMAVLEEAITLAREALRLTPRDHPGTGAQLNSLATILLIAFKNAGSVSVREAAQFDSPLAGTLSRLFRTMPLLSPEVLEEGVQAARDAVRVTPLDHPDRGEFLINLGHALEVKVERGGPAELLDEALRCYREAGDRKAATTLLRISGYRRYARAAGAAPGHAGAGLRAIEDAIGLVDTFAPRSLVRPDRQHQLSRLNELPGEAAAAALHAGRPVRAVELLEQTRGILAADVLALRSAEQIRLRACAPELAGELDRLRTRLAELDPPDRAAEREPAEGGGAGPQVGAAAVRGARRSPRGVAGVARADPYAARVRGIHAGAGRRAAGASGAGRPHRLRQHQRHPL
ncbi:hypothetical protein ACJ6WF_35110 [Streptomyces sp. MMS24-I2-30]|uniref:hypothetical protein n=1 Tax=Streptomyces sp. MMS24-I2-30 TaxID=3351564 RepID=UPI003896ABB6